MLYDNRITFKIAAARNLVLLICFMLLATGTFAQRKLDESTPTADITIVPEKANSTDTFSGNYTCANLNALGNTSHGGAYARIVDDNELKLDFSSPNGTFQFRNYTSPSGYVSLTGTQPSPIKSLHITSSSSSVRSFSSQVQILAVIIKAGNTSYVYSYAYNASPITYSGGNLLTGSYRDISHVSFCYGVSVSPSAAPASLSGRVVDATGRGISGASVTVLDPNSGASMSARSNPFGYYTFTSLPAGSLYVVSIRDKRYTFNNDTRSVTLNEDLADMDFIANPE